MTREEEEIQCAKLFDQITALTQGFGRQPVTMALINLIAKDILIRASEQGRDVVGIMEFAFQEIGNAIITNLDDDKRVPQVKDLIKRAMEQ